MTEADWLKSTDPQAMLNFLRASGKLSDRKARLFACAAVRRVWHLVSDERSRQAVEAAEDFADGRGPADRVFPATVSSWTPLGSDFPASMAAFVAACGGLIIPALAAWGASRAAAGSLATSELVRIAAWHDAYVAQDIGSAWARGDADQEQNWQRFASGYWEGDPDRGRDEEMAVQAALLRDIVGPWPLRPLSPLPPSVRAWNDGTIVKLATAIDEERKLPEGTLDSVRLGVLADVLEDVGADVELVGHLRRPGPHWRGCWAVDCLLGKS